MLGYHKTDSETLLGLSPSTSILDVENGLIMTLALDLFSRSIQPQNLKKHADSMCGSFQELLALGSELTMLPNYSIDPTGDEHGDYLVIDLGGLTLRVAVVSIAPPSEKTSQQDRITIVSLQKWQVENSNKHVDLRFFAWIGEKIAETLAGQTAISSQSVINTGITWSFSLESTSHNSANILHMGKGYVIDKEIYGQNLKEVLELSVLEHQNLKINVQSIINDSLAVYAAGCFIDSTTKLAMVLGTGLNFCCLLQTLDKIHQLKHLASEKRCLFNTETSLFGCELVEPFATKYDLVIDRRFASVPEFSPHMSLDPLTNEIFQPSECLALGRYLPELVRLVLVEMIEKGDVFANQKKLLLLNTEYEGLSGELICFIHECDDESLIAQKIEDFYSWAANSVLRSDVVSVKLIVEAVIRRAAYIVAIAIVAFIKLLDAHNGKQKTFTIGYVGSVMTYFHKMRGMVAEYVKQSVEDVEVELHIVNESSVVGAAIGAACHSK